MLLAKGLKVEYLTRERGEPNGHDGLLPGGQARHISSLALREAPRLSATASEIRLYSGIDLKNGLVETVLRGMDRCDGIRTTPWGTILATEETGDGNAYEIFDPLATTEVTITARNGCGAAATIAKSPGSNNVIKRIALPCMAWEGLIVQPSGVVIGGDELRPGDTGADTDGGAIFKFVPTTLRTETERNHRSQPVALIAGATFAMQVSCNGGNQGFGQGCEVGNAAWVAVTAATARTSAENQGATGYYRPEDLERMPISPTRQSRSDSLLLDQHAERQRGQLWRGGLWHR